MTDPTKPTCDLSVYWWDGEYEGECKRPVGHEGDHWDGLSWFNDDKEPKDYDHDGGPDDVA